MTIKRRLLALIGLSLVMASPVVAQEFSVDFGDGASLSGRSVQLILLLTVLSLAPGLAVMITCFPLIVTVLSILRQAIGVQQAPPNMMIVGLAMFLSWYVMDPVLTDAWEQGLGPLSREEMEPGPAITAALVPFRAFMASRMDMSTFEHMANLRPNVPAPDTVQNAPLSLLVPTFMLSEIKRAFEIGFYIFLPFLVIDLVVSAVLMSMGMMMVPPASVSLPFKLAFFVVADGWTLLSEALVRSYIGGG